MKKNRVEARLLMREVKTLEEKGDLRSEKENTLLRSKIEELEKMFEEEEKKDSEEDDKQDRSVEVPAYVKQKKDRESEVITDRDYIAAEIRRYTGKGKSEKDERALTEHKLRVQKRVMDTSVTAPIDEDAQRAGILEGIRDNAVVFQAGAQQIILEPGAKMSQAKVTGDITIAWRNESEAFNASDFSMGSVEWDPKSCAVEVKVTKEFLNDAEGASAFLQSEMARAFGVFLDGEVLHGSDAKGITGILGTAGIGATDADPEASWDNYITAKSGIMAANHRPNAVICSPGVYGSLSGLKDSQSAYLEPPKYLTDLQWLQTNSVASDDYALVGDFTRAMVAFSAGGFQLMIDPYRLSNLGQVAILGYLRCDLALSHVEAFHAIQNTP